MFMESLYGLCFVEDIWHPEEGYQAGKPGGHALLRPHWHPLQTDPPGRPAQGVPHEVGNITLITMFNKSDIKLFHRKIHLKDPMQDRLCKDLLFYCFDALKLNPKN